MNIYIVDDDTVTLGLLAAVLEKAGHIVHHFTDGESAWECFQEAPVPLVITDWLMPGMSGLDLCRKIRRLPGIAYTNVVLVTSLSDAESVNDAYEAGIDDMFGKPIDGPLLLRRIAATERGQLAHVEQAMRKSLSICQDALGPEHTSLLEALNELATVTRRQKAYVRCRAFIRREIGISEQAFGRDDHRTRRLAAELEELETSEEAF